MHRPNTILVYSDYKSPYAFLAKDLIYELEDQFDVHLEWLPYTLDIPSYLGSATLDERGEVIESNRNAHQWRRVHRVFERFWRRELDIEDAEAIASVLSEVHAGQDWFPRLSRWCGSN